MPSLLELTRADSWVIEIVRGGWKISVAPKVGRAAPYLVVVTDDAGGERKRYHGAASVERAIEIGLSSLMQAGIQHDQHELMTFARAMDAGA